MGEENELLWLGPRLTMLALQVEVLDLSENPPLGLGGTVHYHPSHMVCDVWL